MSTKRSSLSVSTTASASLPSGGVAYVRETLRDRDRDRDDDGGNGNVEGRRGELSNNENTERLDRGCCCCCCLYVPLQLLLSSSGCLQSSPLAADHHHH